MAKKTKHKDGSGRLHERVSRDCPSCHGTGKISMAKGAVAKCEECGAEIVAKPGWTLCGRSKYEKLYQKSGLYRLTHCRHCGCDMASPARIMT